MNTTQQSRTRKETFSISLDDLESDELNEIIGTAFPSARLHAILVRQGKAPEEIAAIKASEIRGKKRWLIKRLIGEAIHAMTDFLEEGGRIDCRPGFLAEEQMPLRFTVDPDGNHRRFERLTIAWAIDGLLTATEARHEQGGAS